MTDFTTALEASCREYANQLQRLAFFLKKAGLTMQQIEKIASGEATDEELESWLELV